MSDIKQLEQMMEGLINHKAQIEQQIKALETVIELTRGVGIGPRPLPPGGRRDQFTTALNKMAHQFSAVELVREMEKLGPVPDHYRKTTLYTDLRGLVSSGHLKKIGQGQYRKLKGDIGK